jgi:flagellar motor protein MotB
MAETKTKMKPGPKAGFFEEKITEKVKKELEDIMSLDPTNGKKLFLVEGMVQMQPQAPGASAKQTQQNRLVWATDFEDAMKKYSLYFISLNNANAIYVVLGMAASEAII